MTSLKAWTPAATVPLHSRLHDRAALQCVEHERVLPVRWRARPIPANRIYGPGLAALDIYPTPNFSGGNGLNFTSQDPQQPPRGEQLLRMDFQATNNWRITGRYMKNSEDILQAHGTTGRQRQRPPPDAGALRAPRLELHALRNRYPEQHHDTRAQLGARGQLADYQLQNPDLFRAAAGLSAMPLIYPTAVQADYIPDFAAGAQPTPASTRRTAARSPTRTSPTT